MGGNYEKDIYKQLMQIMERCDSLENNLRSVKSSSNSKISSLNSDVKRLTSKCNELEEQNTDLQKKVNSLEKENLSLKEENLRLKSIMNNNSDNTSLPPSSDQKPSKKKVNEYNGRQNTGRKSGGQKGHTGTTLTKKSVEGKIRSGSFEHCIENWVDGVPVSTDDVPDTDYISHYVIDLEIQPVAKELRFYADKSGNHHIPKQYLGEVTYGNTIKSLAVDLYSEGNMSLTRIQNLINSISKQAISVSEGSIYGFLSRFVSHCDPSLKQIEVELLREKALCTDATYTSTDGVQSYIRNISTDAAVRYYPMSSKTIEEHQRIDILRVFQGILIHDHETALYHFGADHGECNVHILRYLRKNTEETGNKWSDDMIQLLTNANDRLKDLSAKDEFFSDEEAMEISKKYEKILADGYEQNQNTLHKYAKEEELTLLNRLTKYQHNHLLFLTEPNVKFHNNVSERDLRKCKTHQKMSGGFRKESGSKLYCDIMSIIETCKKKKMQVFDSILNIFAGKRAIY